MSRGKLFAIGVSVIVSMILATAKSTQVPPLVPFFYRCLGAASVLLCISIYSCGYGIVTQITGRAADCPLKIAIYHKVACDV